MKTLFNIPFAPSFTFILGVSMMISLMISCQKSIKSGETKPTNCKFIAGLAEGGDNREADFKAQVAAFNQNYTLYQKGEMSASQVDNPYHQTPYHLGVDPTERPNNLLDSFSRLGEKVGLMIGFGKPVATENIVTLYLIMLKEEFTQVDSQNCKVAFQVAKADSIELYYSYNTRSGLWSPMDKSIIDKWVSNLYDADPAHAPVFKGYYIHHEAGKNADMDDYFYAGLKKGTTRDTLNIFSLNHPCTEAGKDIQFSYTRFLTSSGNLSTSTSFISGDTKNIVRACPPYCAQ
ncbi:MAG: hypothetical protein IPP15_15455 [Saprospiraceae bacterium]|uniref:Lipoprotein n=1 Tax=Candidatus Opimibacter skivensis TaxID=2982028 RepID=A0A9D7XR65_9BACT|nr:hypothetical protein [Candidatus Opimibacter skivensis]